MKNFLSSNLPDTGIYFIAAKYPHGKGFKHYPCRTIEDMVVIATRLDKTKQDVYFACASFKQESYVNDGGETQYRTAENASWAKSFWIDIDCGADKAAKGQGSGLPNTRWGYTMKTVWECHNPTKKLWNGIAWPKAITHQSLTNGTPAPLCIERARIADIPEKREKPCQ